MKNSAYILDWTMNDYDNLKFKLKNSGFEFEKAEKEHIRVTVPFNKIDSFVDIVQVHLNAPQNYVDVQFPDEKKSIVIFQAKKFVITNDKENEKVKEWAISIGLPTEQADWKTSY